MSALFTQCPGDTVQIGTGKVDPDWIFKCSTSARGMIEELLSRIKSVLIFKYVDSFKFSFFIESKPEKSEI